MLKTNEEKDTLNFFSLASILSASAGFPFIVLGSMLTKQYAPGITIGSVFVGNLILWVIGITIISMAKKEHINGIQNVKNHVGKLGALLVAGILLFAFLNWFAFHITNTVSNIREMTQASFFLKSDALIRIGAALGLISALLSIGGTRLLQKISLITLPLLIIYYSYALLRSEISFPNYSLGLSFSAILTTVLAFLPGMINLPTIFRHSRSPADSYIGLTCFALFITFIECTSIWISDPSTGLLVIGKITDNSVNLLEALSLIFMISICNGLLNIYFASACYETFSPHFSGTKGHAIIGLLGTAVYAFVQVSAPLELLLDLFNGYLTSLTTVLLISFLIRIMVKHRTRNFEKWINFFAWIVGCVSGTFAKLSNPQDEVNFLLIGVISSTLCFLIIVFIEETIWSIRQVLLQRALKQKS